MEMKKRVLTGALCGALLVGTVVPALAATEHYNNGASVGGSAEWTAWTQDWESVATDYTKVSLTPGADETELNFAWYSKGRRQGSHPRGPLRHGPEQSQDLYRQGCRRGRLPDRRCGL